MRGQGGELLHAEETFQIRGAVFEVQRTMGGGFLEAVYQECLGLEFAARRIPFDGLRPLALRYKGQLLRQRYTPDFICFDKVIVELKAAKDLAPEHRAQLLNYLRATGLTVGLLVNFGPQAAKVERVVLEPTPSA
jgi:GxxExxY protein